MKICVVSNAGYCLPLLHLIVSNKLKASVFADAFLSDTGDLASIAHFCAGFGAPFCKDQPEQLYPWLEQERPDLVFVIGYRHLIDIRKLPAAVVNNIFNIHFGDLPAFRGPNPVFWHIRKGMPHITACIHRLDAHFDRGAVVWTKQIPREPFMSFGAAHSILSNVMLEGVIVILQHRLQNKTLPVYPSSSEKTPYYSRPQLKDVLIDWNMMAATEITHIIAACNPWNKGANTTLQSREVKIIDAEVITGIADADSLPGTILKSDTGWQVKCADHTLLRINMLNIDSTFVPARYAAMFGIEAGQRFGS